MPNPTNAKHEIEVFVEFVRAAKLPIDLETIVSRDKPDIACTYAGKELYFELGRLLDEERQRMRLHAMKTRKQVAGADYKVGLPERDMLKQKIAKAEKYDVGGKPIELLLYYDNTSWLVGDVPMWTDYFPEHASHAMKPWCDSQSTFRRVWVYDRHSESVLWCYPAA